MKRKYIVLITVLSLVFCHNNYGQTETEPNDSFNDANTLTLNNFTVTVQGTISTNSDKDFYKVDIPQSGVFVLNAFNITNGVDMEIDIYDSTQNLIASKNVTNSSTINLTQLVCGSGTYFFRFRDFNDNDDSADLYSFTVSLDTEDIYECNNDFASASTIALNQTINAKIRDVGDVDYFKIDIPQSGVLVVDAFNITNSIDMEIAIYDSTQNLIASRSAVNSSTIDLTELVCSGGTYFFRFKDSTNNDSSSELYSFTIILDTSDVYECNNDFTDATSISICETLTGAIYDTGDQDYFTFTGTANQEISVSLTNVASNIRPVATIYDATQNQVSFHSGNTGQALNFDFTPPSTGQFYLKLEDSGNNSANSQLYQLSIMESDCTLSNEDVLLENSFTIFPNPTKDSFSVQNLGLLSIEKIIIYDLNGKKLHSQTNATNISTSKLKKGVYFVQIITNETTISKRLVKL